MKLARKHIIESLEKHDTLGGSSSTHEFPLYTIWITSLEQGGWKIEYRMKEFFDYAARNRSKA